MLFTTPESPCPRPPGGPKMLSRQPATLDLDELQLRIRTASATQLPALAPSPSAAAQPGFNSISQPAPVPSPPPKAMAQCGSCPNMAHVGGGSPPSGGSPLNASSMLLGNKNAQWKPQMKPALSETHSSLPPPTPQPQQREAQETSPVPEKKKSGVNLGRISQMFKGALKGSFFQSSTNSSSNNTATQGFSKLSGQFARNSTKSNRSVDLEDEAGPCDVPPSRAEAASPPPITVVATKLPPDTVKDSVKDSASSPLPKQSSSPQVHLSSALPETPAAPTPIAVPPPTPFATVQSPLGTPPASEQPHSQHSQGVAKTHLMSQKSMEYAAAAEAEARLARRAASISKYVGTPSMLLVVTRDLPARMLRPVWSLRDYTVLEKMYTGYASNVYKAKCKYSGVLVCLKSYTLGALCELNRYQIFREVRVHSSLSHENIIKLYGAFQQGDQVVLVQEYANSGDLFTLLHKYGGRLPERNAVEVVLQPFLSVINYLHANGIVHRDIKPENILFTSDMRLKLCDFGLAINMREERAVTRVGTLEYMAPEVLDCPFKNKPEENKGNRMLQYSYHVDTWAVGVLTYELLVGLPPFNDKQRNAVEGKIRAAPPRFPSKMSEQCRDFITMALEKNPLERPTVVEMLNHSWMRMHKRSNSVQQLSTLERQQSLGSPGHGASRCPSQNLGLIQEEEPANGVPPPQLPSTQAVLCSPTHSPAPPKAKPLPIAANKAASAQPRHLAGGKGAYDVDVLSSSYTSGALPLTAFPGMVNAAAGKTTAPNPSLFVPVLDKHIAQQEQAVQAAQAAHAAQQRQAAQQEQAAQVAQAAQAAQAAHVTQQRLRPLQQSSRPNSFDAGAAVAPVADTNTLSPLAPRHAPFLPSSCSPRAASLADAAPGMHAHSLGSPPKASSLTKALRSLA